MTTKELPFAMVVGALLSLSFVLWFIFGKNTHSEGGACPAGSAALTETRLFMGRDIGGVGTVSDADWRAFVKAEVIPRFPDGFTVLDGAGYWKGCKKLDSQGVCEKSKLLLIQYSPSDTTNRFVTAIMDAYIRRFNQQAVMRSDTTACTTFYTGEK